MIRYAVVLCAALLYPSLATAQNVLINIRGIVLEERTGKPLGKDMDMVITAQSTGKKTTAKVNTKSGEFLQPLTSGDKYTIVFSSYAIYKKTEVLDIPATRQYREDVKSFTVRALVQGEEIHSLAAFAPTQSTINSAVTSKLDEVKEALKQNRDMKVVVTLANEQTPPPPPPPVKKETKPAKKAKKGAPVEAAPVVAPVAAIDYAQLAKELYDARVAALKQYFADVKNSELRISYVQGATIAPAPGLQTVKIAVGEVKSMLDE
ncbi:MAG: hypothetical protein JNL32_02460 [Candidatus Kapabacteria bacterium]|nr:hypothetical protein [Candidatus Kapabacteria bacterium]